MASHSFKLIVSLILISFLLFYPLQIARAVAGWLIIMKEFALDLVARVITRTLMSVLSNTVVGKILTSGREIIPGVPTSGFVQDWRDFLSTAQYRGEDIFRAQLADATIGGNATVCPYLRQALAGSFNANPIPGFDPSKYRTNNLQLFNIRNKCTLPSNFNVSLFRNDFAAGGGWAVWNQLIQPQNNFLGVYDDSLSELENQREFEENIDEGEAESGSGYTSKRTGCSGSGANKQCTILGKIVTPADLFGKAGAQTIDAEFGWLFSADEIQEALVSLASIVANRLTNLATGALLGVTQGTLGPGTGEAPPPPNATQQAQQDCVKSKEPGCTLKAKKLQCDVTAEGGEGGSGGTSAGGGSGGSASANCVETIDQGVYDACMAEAKIACGL